MAIVYLCENEALGRNAAIKVLPHQYTFDEAFIQRFMNEARINAKLEQENIVRIYDSANWMTSGRIW